MDAICLRTNENCGLRMLSKRAMGWTLYFKTMKSNSRSMRNDKFNVVSHKRATGLGVVAPDLPGTVHQELQLSMQKDGYCRSTKFKGHEHEYTLRASGRETCNFRVQFIHARSERYKIPNIDIVQSHVVLSNLQHGQESATHNAQGGHRHGDLGRYRA